MSKLLSSLPSRPLKKSEVLSMSDKAREYCIRPESNEAFVISFLGENQVHALGFDEDAEQWVQFHTTDMAYSEESAQALDDAINRWTKSQYGERIDDGDLYMAGLDDPPVEVQMGLEPEYDCPDCSFYETGTTTRPQTFLNHLREDHDYSSSEAHAILNGKD
ncbi:hypothetical protein [Halosolutus halophilus]|uniref:hypothetical protein n=1 Tax=Halosolutus halophilus TaxID=1552990 RepID=UPI002234F739|nr:hypothetical protein [Halosolutus halophilus]